VVAFNLYPMLSQKQFVRTTSGRIRIRFPAGDAATVERAASLYWERYGRPLLLGETAARGTVPRRLSWLRESVAGVRAARAAGVPLVGYTWWPMFDLLSWAYRQGRGPLSTYVVPMGLWRLDPETLDRQETPLVGAFSELVAGGAGAVGPIAQPTLLPGL
jgi:beta-glucosidase